jgi:hypothetical protein
MTDNMVNDQKPVPDPKSCWTVYMGKTLNFSTCQTGAPNGCEYALRFASCVFCSHPDRRSFERTLTGRQLSAPILSTSPAPTGL